MNTVNTPIKYRKKPVVSEAMRLTKTNAAEVAAWCGGRVISEAKPSDPTDVYVGLDIPTLEGVMRAQTYHGGDYVIRGAQGEFYPCKPDIFEATYEAASLAGIEKRAERSPMSTWTAVPALTAAVRDVLALHREATCSRGYPQACCVDCDQTWPCATVRALAAHLDLTDPEGDPT